MRVLCLDETVQPSPAWSVVVPVKRLETAKTRLGDGHRPPRGELALAFATDCLTALAGASRVCRIVVVSSEQLLRPIATALGAEWLDEVTPAGLNTAAGSALALLDGPAAVVVGDLPSLTAPAADLALGLADAQPLAFLSDAAGVGTTMLMSHDPRECLPSFGARSRARHRSAGFVELGLEVAPDRDSALDLARARRDVDTGVDLADALRLGVGAATAQVLRLT